MEEIDYYTTKLFELKKQFRASALRSRDALAEADRSKKSRLIMERLSGMPAAGDARTWFVYVSFASEVDTRGLIRRLLAEGKAVCVPSVDRASKVMTPSRIASLERDLAPGCFGIPEPAPGCLHPVKKSEIDIVIVPGAAFSTDGFRIGYGGGYYDRFLKDCPAASIGLAFEIQVFGRVPHDVQRDMPVGCIVTENRIIRSGSAWNDQSCRR
jgi:5-formyltetrahydrofolate cyclo-ligase